LKTFLKSLSRLALLAAAVSVSGCEPASTPVEAPSGGVAQLIKQNLQNPAETGQTGSEMMQIEQDLEKLAAEDPAKAETAKKDFAALKAAKSPDQIKAKAKEMMGKL